MIAIQIGSNIFSYNSIDHYWNQPNKPFLLRPNTPHYNALPEIEFYNDGWRPLIEPEIDVNTQRLGSEIWDAENDVFTRQIIDLSQNELLHKFTVQTGSTQYELIEGEKQRQAMATFQAITDEVEAFEVKEVFPFWDETFDYLTQTANYKVTRTLIEDGVFVLGLFFLIQPHTPAIGDVSFYPENAPALWSRVIIGAGGVEVWTQPTGGDGKYPYLDISTGLPYRVSHIGFIWENSFQGGLNVWEPGAFGWTQIEPL